MNIGTGWYDTFFRGYDPALGRFMQVDPVATSTLTMTPYNFAGNNPVLFNDPMGDKLANPNMEAMINGTLDMRSSANWGGGGWDIGMLKSAVWAVDARFSDLEAQ